MNWKLPISGALCLGYCATEGEDVHEKDPHRLSICHVFDVYFGASIRKARDKN